MRTRRMLVITKQWLAVILVLALLPWFGIAAAAPSLDEQLIEAAKIGDLSLVKILLEKGAGLNAEDYRYRRFACL